MGWVHQPIIYNSPHVGTLIDDFRFVYCVVRMFLLSDLLDTLKMSTQSDIHMWELSLESEECLKDPICYFDFLLPSNHF